MAVGVQCVLRTVTVNASGLGMGPSVNPSGVFLMPQIYQEDLRVAPWSSWGLRARRVLCRQTDGTTRKWKLEEDQNEVMGERKKGIPSVGLARLFPQPPPCPTPIAHVQKATTELRKLRVAVRDPLGQGRWAALHGPEQRWVMAMAPAEQHLEGTSRAGTCPCGSHSQHAECEGSVGGGAGQAGRTGRAACVPASSRGSRDRDLAAASRGGGRARAVTVARHPKEARKAKRPMVLPRGHQQSWLRNLSSLRASKNFQGRVEALLSGRRARETE